MATYLYAGPIIDSGCLDVTFEKKTAPGTPRPVNYTGPWNLGLYVQAVIRIGLSHTKPVISMKYPPISYCLNCSAIESGTFPEWIKYTNVLPILHNISKYGNMFLD